MQKLIIIALLATFAYSAGIGTTCAATGANANGYLDDAGICRFCHPTCATCVGEGADKCVTCRAAETVTANCAKPTGGSATGAACTCAANKLTVKTAGGLDFECCPNADMQNHASCPDGFGKVVADTNKIQCAICTETCKACDVADATPVSACTGCHDSTTAAGTPKTCPAAANKFLIKWGGSVDACPDGYFGHATTKVCESITVAGCITGSSKTVCTACATNHELKADGSACTKCTDAQTYNTTTKKCDAKLPLGCTEADATDATKCAKEKCDTTKGWKKNDAAGACECQQNLWKKVVTADAAKNIVAATTCEKCADSARATCEAADTCNADGTKCTPASTTPATVADSDKPGAACTDATLKASGCVKCADGTKCDTCFAGQAFNATEKVCLCSAGADTAAWDGPTMKCVNCPAKCTDATKKYCNIKTAGNATTAAVAECTGTAPAAAAKAVGDAAAAAATGNDSNGILISAISMILAVILA